MTNKDKITLLIDTLKETVRDFSSPEGITLICLNTIKDAKPDKTMYQGTVFGDPIELIYCLLEAMHDNPEFRAVVTTAASSFQLYERFRPPMES